MHEKEELVCAEGEFYLCLREVGTVSLRGYKPPQPSEHCQKLSIIPAGQGTGHTGLYGTSSRQGTMWQQQKQ